MRPLILLLLLIPTAAHAATHVDAVLALDVDPAAIVSAGVEAGGAAQVEVLAALGGIPPLMGAEMVMLSPGFEYATTELAFEVLVPSDAVVVALRWMFISLEYPQWLGSEYTDRAEILVEGSSFSGRALYDPFGNSVSINSTFFEGFPHASELVGTAFEGAGSTRWITTWVPVEGGDLLGVRVQLIGCDDSALLLDDLLFLDANEAAEVDGPISNRDDPHHDLELHAVTPSHGPLEGDDPVLISGFDLGLAQELWFGPSQVDFALKGTDYTVLSAITPPAPDAQPGPVDLRLVGDGQDLILPGGYTYQAPLGDGDDDSAAATGEREPPQDEPVGCSCDSAQGGGAWGLLLLPVLLRRRSCGASSRAPF